MPSSGLSDGQLAPVTLRHRHGGRRLATLDAVKPDKILGSLFEHGGFSPQNFGDLFYPIAVASLVLLVATVVLYNVQTRRLRHHPVLVNLNEWLFWTGLTVFGLLLVCAIFKFYFAFVLLTIVVGLGTFIWIRFFRFPPLIGAYNQSLRRQAYLSGKRYATAESTIRAKSKGKSRTRPRSSKND
jgi:hypothetical protein